MSTKIQIHRGAAADWSTNNPVLLAGEIGVELEDTSKFKIGDGVTTWRHLPYGGETADGEKSASGDGH